MVVMVVVVNGDAHQRHKNHPRDVAKWLVPEMEWLNSIWVQGYVVHIEREIFARRIEIVTVWKSTWCGRNRPNASTGELLHALRELMFQQRTIKWKDIASSQKNAQMMQQKSFLISFFQKQKIIINRSTIGGGGVSFYIFLLSTQLLNMMNISPISMFSKSLLRRTSTLIVVLFYFVSFFPFFLFSYLELSHKGIKCKRNFFNRRTILNSATEERKFSMVCDKYCTNFTSRQFHPCNGTNTFRTNFFFQCCHTLKFIHTHTHTQARANDDDDYKHNREWSIWIGIFATWSTHSPLWKGSNTNIVHATTYEHIHKERKRYQ